MAGTTTRLQLPYPVAADNVDVPRDVKALTDKLDPLAAVFATGTNAARPAAGTVGRFYFATDTAQLYFDTGAAWVALNADPIPIGILTPFAGTVAPSALWLLCDGSTVSRTTYAALFALAGTAFNTGGEAGTDFRLPDLRGRGVIGAGQGSGLTNRALGARGGEETHALTAGEGSVNGNGTTGNQSANHVHGPGVGLYLSNAGTAWAWAQASGAAQIYINGLPNTLTENANHAHTFNGRAADTPHNTMQPFVTLGAIVKAL